MPLTAMSSGCAESRGRPKKRSSTWGPPYAPSGRLMPCTTSSSGRQPSGRSLKNGESNRRSPCFGRIQPPSSKATSAGSRVRSKARSEISSGRVNATALAFPVNGPGAGVRPCNRRARPSKQHLPWEGSIRRLHMRPAARWLKRIYHRADWRRALALAHCAHPTDAESLSGRHSISRSSSEEQEVPVRREQESAECGRAWLSVPAQSQGQIASPHRPEAAAQTRPGQTARPGGLATPNAFVREEKQPPLPR